jgi:hypothetical protein
MADRTLLERTNDQEWITQIEPMIRNAKIGAAADQIGKGPIDCTAVTGDGGSVSFI